MSMFSVPHARESLPIPTPLIQPRAPRFRTLLLVGRMVSARHDALCRIRNISEGGLMAEARADFAAGECVRIELRNGNSIAGSVRWTDGGTLGIMFDAPADPQRLLSEPAMARQPRVARVPRSPRLPTDCAAEIRIDGRVQRVKLRDLSQGGARLVIAMPLERDALLTLAVPGLGLLRASVRWVRDDQAGIAFLEAIAFATLAEWFDRPALRYAASETGRIALDPARTGLSSKSWAGAIPARRSS